jgi:hypothetical protein
MRRLSLIVGAGFLGCVIGGCGENQPNAPAQPAEANADFIKKTADMMKDANAGMDLKKARSNAAPK